MQHNLRLTLSRQSLGELATIIPVSGSFTEYSSRFVDDSLAFGLGWAYWYLWVTVSCHCLHPSLYFTANVT